MNTVGVVIPCYNQARFLIEALHSVSAQDYPHWLIVVVDDASQDGEELRTVLCGFANQHPERDFFIYLVELKENGGLSNARNVGMKAAIEMGATLLLPLDADDVLLGGTISARVEALEKSGAAIAYGDYAEWFEGTRAIGIQAGIWTRACMRGRNVTSYGILFTAEMFTALGGYDTTLEIAEDWEFEARAMARGYEATYVPGVAFLHRRHDGNLYGPYLQRNGGEGGMRRLLAERVPEVFG